MVGTSVRFFLLVSFFQQLSATLCFSCLNLILLLLLVGGDITLTRFNCKGLALVRFYIISSFVSGLGEEVCVESRSLR